MLKNIQKRELKLYNFNQLFFISEFAMSIIKWETLQ